MSKEKLNILPVPTFGQVGVNFVERELENAAADETAIVCTEGETAAAEITGSAKYTITAAEGKSGFVIQYINSDSSTELLTEVKADKGARVKLVQIFDSANPVVSRLGTELYDSASLELIQLYLRGCDTVSEIVTGLGGRRSALGVHIGYTLKGSEQLDINLVADHRGRKSTSEITVRGVLAERSQKTFKGTIDFKNGASGAKGAEHEAVLLMSEEVRSRTVPVILCAEEDVEGNHGATAGRIDERHIFYMKSRGIPEEKIYELMARSMLTQVIKRIGDEKTERRVYEALGWGDENE